MMMKNTENKNKEFNHDKNETTIQMFSYLGAGVKIRKTKKMVEVQNTVFHNKDSSITKMRIRTHNPVERRMKTYILMKMVKHNLNKSFKLNKVEKYKNGVCREQSLVDN